MDTYQTAEDRNSFALQQVETSTRLVYSAENSLRPEV